MELHDDKFDSSIPRPTAYPTQVDNNRNLSPINFADVMQNTMWMVKAVNKKEEVEYACVCISKEGLLLTSSDICTDKFRLTGRSMSDKKYRQLMVDFVDEKSGWGMVKPRETRPDDSFEYASISNNMVRSGVTVLSIVHLKTLKSQFSCLKGRTTHRCEFDPKQLEERVYNAINAHTTYLNFGDVSNDQGKYGKHLPVLSVHGFFYSKELTGSPLFDSTGVVIGLIWFGDGSFVYGIPAQTIIHGLSRTDVIGNIVSEDRKIYQMEEGNMSLEKEGDAGTSKKENKDKKEKKEKKGKKRNEGLF